MQISFCLSVSPHVYAFLSGDPIKTTFFSGDLIDPIEQQQHILSQFSSEALLELSGGTKELILIKALRERDHKVDDA